MIRTEQVTKSFEGTKVLEDLSVTVPKGSVYGLIGPNGAGKTTLLRHITGIYRPDAGFVTLGGEPVYENPAAKARFAYIPDEVYFFTQASIRDMMRFYRGIRPGFSPERFEKLREVFSLDDKKPMRRLSRGMQKQAAFWLAMSMSPEVLILDEPVDGLDPVMRRQVWSILLADTAERGTTVLVSSHNLREMEDVCDHVGILNRGRLLLEHSLSELQDNVVKVQLVLAEGTALPEGLNILHEGGTGKLRTLIVRGKPEETACILAAVNPVFLDTLPLSLEEIFIYELGGADYAVKDILL
jgi:ABC-2 type transport system ATP-binding protein